jgi:hypothetical protein
MLMTFHLVKMKTMRKILTNGSKLLLRRFDRYPKGIKNSFQKLILSWENVSLKLIGTVQKSTAIKTTLFKILKLMTVLIAT